MKKKLGAICAATVLILAAAAFVGSTQAGTTEPRYIDTEIVITPTEKPDVVIPMSASRPGCEEADWCYSPSEIATDVGGTITWLNEDSGFHTVTSGYYDDFDGAFDSGHIDPGKTFSYTFEKSGDFHYYCNLHPWMEGTVTVK
jgi:plastocyanin